MPKYVIERHVEGAGNMTPEQLQGAAQKSNGVLRNLPDVQWVHSYVGGDRIYCVYNAPDEEVIRKHARECGLSAEKITRVSAIIDPVTAEGGRQA
jgi:hypothetical protein